MTMEKRFLEAHGIEIKPFEKVTTPSKPAKIAEAAGYVHRNIGYSLENLGGKHWALVVVNKDNKEKFERHPLDSNMLGGVLDMLGAIDFDNWDSAKLSLDKLHFKQLGAIKPPEEKEPEVKPEESKKK